MNVYQKIAGFVISIGLATPLGLYAKQLSDRPSQTLLQQTLFKGITYERNSLQKPRPQVIHILKIDLTTPGLTPFVTPGFISEDTHIDTHAQTTSDFLEAFNLQVAVNAGYFGPFYENTPWDFYPHSGDRTNTIGEFISEGNRYSENPIKWPKLCFTKQKAIIIQQPVHCPPDTLHAVAGNLVLHPRLKTDPPRTFRKNEKYPRTIAAINGTGETLWLIIADGKQPHYSEGLRLSEAESLLGELGAQIGINLDGGGSVTLVQDTPDGAKVLNAPIHGKWPMTERPIATHLGFYAPSTN